MSGEWEKLDTVKGYIKAIDSETLTIGERFWKKEILLERIQMLTIPDTDHEMDSVKGIDSPFGSRTLQTEIVLEVGEIDSSTVEVGDFVEVIYGKGDPVSGEWEGVKKVKGYVKAVDAEYLIVGERFLEEQIALARVQKITILDDNRGIDKLSQPMDSLSVRMETRFRTGLMFEAGYFWGIRTEFLDFYSSGYKTNKGLPLSASLYINPIFSGERQGRLGLRGTYQTVQIFPKFPEQELLQRFPLVLEEDFRRHRDRHISGFTFRLVSILLVYQRVVHKSKRSVVLVDVAGGISYQSSSYNSGGEQLESPKNFPCGSVGIAFLMPVHSRVSLQASVRKGWLVGYFPDPFISGMSAAIGPLLEF
ncbi:MAG: hypothetical protein OXG87_05330 [Gemmatimonadetes bacterium]|nr:hypothetical protein [Gemmatimonadota bacterium]